MTTDCGWVVEERYGCGVVRVLGRKWARREDPLAARTGTLGELEFRVVVRFVIELTKGGNDLIS